MTVQEYFGQLRDMKEEIDCAKELRQEYLEKATSVSASCDDVKVQTSRSDNGKVERYAVLAADLLNEICEKEIVYYNRSHKIVEQIRGSHNRDYMNVLFKVYIQFKTLTATAKELRMSYPRCVRVHDEALIEVRKRCGKKKKVNANGTENKAVNE